MQCIRQAGLLLLSACAPALIAAVVSTPRWNEELVAHGEIALKEALSRGPSALWLDARPFADYAIEHVGGALPLNEDQWDELLPRVIETWEPGQIVIVYCNSRTCDASHEVAKRLREFSLGPVFVLHGGWEGWKRK